jgi:ubiquinone/menaquinone biosynthesis C-methylase UbiE
MLARPRAGLGAMVDTLKAAGESSRLRILVLLARGDLTVSEEGSWAYFRQSDAEATREFLDGLIERLDPADAVVERDLERLAAVKRRRQERASDYFSRNAASWDEIRTLHVPDDAVEQALLEAVGDRPIQAMADLGTGTGRMLEIFAPIYRRGIGVDMSREMLSVARANLERAGIQNAQVRQGDLYAPPVERDAFDLVTIHQVLHYLDDPGLAIREAARLLRPSGRLAIVDFAPHSLEFLRDEHAHLRLGFSERQMAEWLEEAGLEPCGERGFVPEEGEGGLTVRLWLARDRRILLATSPTTETA